jgi:hypothetical protein
MILVNVPTLYDLHCTLYSDILTHALTMQGCGAGAETFGWSRSRYTEVSAPAPAPGQIKVVYLIIIHIE